MSKFRDDPEWQRLQQVYLNPPGEPIDDRTFASVAAVRGMYKIESASEQS